MSNSKDISIITLSSLFICWQDIRNSCRRRKQKTYSYRNFCRATWIRPKRPNECNQHQLYRRQVWAYLEIVQTLIHKYLALLLCEYDNEFFLKKYNQDQFISPSFFILHVGFIQPVLVSCATIRQNPLNFWEKIVN